MAWLVISMFVNADQDEPSSHVDSLIVPPGVWLGGLLSGQFLLPEGGKAPCEWFRLG